MRISIEYCLDAMDGVSKDESAEFINCLNYAYIKARDAYEGVTRQTNSKLLFYPSEQVYGPERDHKRR